MPSSAGINSFALNMVILHHVTISPIFPEISQRVILLAERTFAPGSMAAFLEGSGSAMQKFVISIILTGNQVFRSVVMLLAIYMVRHCLKWKVFTQSLFHDKNVLTDITILAGSGVTWTLNKDIPMVILFAPVPPWIARTANTVPMHKFNRLPSNPSSFGVGFLCNSGFLATTALAKTFRNLLRCAILRISHGIDLFSRYILGLELVHRANGASACLHLSTYCP